MFVKGSFLALKCIKLSNYLSLHLLLTHSHRDNLPQSEASLQYLPGGETTLRGFTPKNVPTALIIKKEANATINPIIENTILFLAASIFPLSPWEVIQAMPPQTKKIKAAKVTIIRRAVRPKVTAF